MNPIPINVSTDEIYRQLLFIDNFIVTIVNKKAQRRGLAVLVYTVLVIVIFFFTNADSGVVGLVMAPFVWVGFGLYLLYIKWKTYKRQKVTLKKLAELILSEVDRDTKFCFTEEEISLIQKDTTTTIKWNEFTAYLEDDTTIYLFQDNPYLPWSFSAMEVDETIVAAVKTIVKQKIPPLDTPKVYHLLNCVSTSHQ